MPGLTGVPLASAEGLRRIAGTRVAGVRHHHRAAVRATRPTKLCEDREANEAGVRPGPRVYGTGYLMEWRRVYYKMGIAISSVRQFGNGAAARRRCSQHDLIKSYVRLPDLQQKRMVEFAHSIGVPVATHEIYPGGAGRRRQHRTHRRDQPARLLAEDGDAAARAMTMSFSCSARAQRILCPMISGSGARASVRARAGAEAGSALQAVSRVDSAPGRGAAGASESGRRRRSGRRQRQDGARRACAPAV